MPGLSDDRVKLLNFDGIENGEFNDVGAKSPPPTPRVCNIAENKMYNVRTCVWYFIY